MNNTYGPSQAHSSTVHGPSWLHGIDSLLFEYGNFISLQKKNFFTWKPYWNSSKYCKLTKK